MTRKKEKKWPSANQTAFTRQKSWIGVNYLLIVADLLSLFLVVVAEVDVFSPVALQDAILRYFMASTLAPTSTSLSVYQYAHASRFTAMMHLCWWGRGEAHRHQTRESFVSFGISGTPQTPILNLRQHPASTKYKVDNHQTKGRKMKY